MKSIIKHLLQYLGLWSFSKKALYEVKSISWKRELLKFRNVNTWKLDFGPLHLKYSTKDWYSKRWFFPRYADGRIHEPITTQIFLDQIKSHHTVLDIGGHIGFFSCVAASLADQGHVHVFEMDPKCIERIKRNASLNQLSNVTVHSMAVSDNSLGNKIPDLVSPNPSLILDSNSKDNFLEIESTSIDDFMRNHGLIPDFIKIDVEGAEGKVLNGMRSLLKSGLTTILVEMHVNELKQHFNTDYKDLISLLLDCGYSILNADHRSEESEMTKVNRNTELSGNSMILCLKDRGTDS